MSLITFSIIMPAYNAEATIEESIISVLNQTYKNYELIIINDCSTDSTSEIINNYANKDKRIKLINLTKNHKVAKARNEGIKKAQGKYIAFLDADDLWLSNKLELQKIYLENGYDLVYSSYIRFTSSNEEKIINIPINANYKSLLKGNFIGNLTGVYNHEKIGKIFQMDIGHEDYLMWLTIIKKCENNLGIQEPLARYRVGNESLSANKIQAAKWMWNIYKKNLSLSTIKSIYYFIHYAKNSIFKRL